MDFFKQVRLAIFLKVTVIATLLNSYIPFAYSEVTPLDLATAALLTYDPLLLDFSSSRHIKGVPLSAPALKKYQILDIEGDPYSIADQEEFRTDFKGVAFVNPEEKILIIAYRGSGIHLPGTQVVDAGIFFSIAGKRNPYAVIIEQCSRFLWNYNKELWALAMTGMGTAEFLSEYTEKSIQEAIRQGKLSPEVFEQFTQWAAKFSNLEIVLLPFLFSHIDGIQIDSSKHSFRNFTKADADNAILFSEKVFAQVCHTSCDLWRIFVTGHSLGGFLAQVAGAYHQLPGMTFNAPGAEEFFTDHYSQPIHAAGVRNYFRENDIVGAVGKHLGEEWKMPNFDDGPYLQSTRAQIQREVEQDYEKEKSTEAQKEKVFEESLRKHFFPARLLLRSTHHLAYYWSTYVWRTRLRTQDSFLDSHGVFNVHQWVRQTYTVSRYLSQNHSIDALVQDLQADPQFIPLR